MNAKRTLLGLVVFVVILSLGAESYAQTPDEMTPAEETVCDGLDGAAFGLCNAYCEAMDCDGLEPQASEKACNKVLENFEKKTGEPMPPCSPVSVCSPEVLEACNDNAQATECPDGTIICSKKIGGLGQCTLNGCPATPH